MNKGFIELKEEEVLEHYNLDKDDAIYHLEYYESGGNYQENSGNNLISNLKKGVDKKGNSEWKHKQKAIADIAIQLAEELNKPHSNVYRKVYWVPVPPSKMKTDPMFDDRVYQILVLAQALCSDSIHLIADVVYQKENRSAFSAVKSTRNIKELSSNYEMNEIPNYDPNTDLIIIFDDVMTSGCHFKAVQSKILEKYSNATIKGVFVARTVSKSR